MCLHGAISGGIKLIEAMSAMSEFNFLIIFQMCNDCVFDSAIHSHTIFGCDDRHGEQIGYGLWVVVHFKVGEKI